MMAQSSPYVVEGPGRAACADFVAWEADSDARRLAAAWLTGYLTAHHRFLPDVFDLTAWQSPGLLLGLLEQYCAAHPDAILERGAQDLVAYLVPRALTEPSEPVALRNGTAVVLVYPPVLTRLRAALRAAGHPAGPGDAGLSAALTEFQAAMDMDQTGLPDQKTLARLLN